MRPIRIGPLSAAGNSNWIPLDSQQVAFAVALAGIPSSGAVLTWKVQHTFDDLSSDSERQVSIARVGTTATVTDANHGLSVGDSIIVMGAGAPFDTAGFTGAAADVASVVDANTYTYTVANSGATASAAGARAKYLRVFDHAVLTGQTARADGNYAFPCAACRFVITAYTNGTLLGEVRQGMGH